MGREAPMDSAAFRARVRRLGTGVGMFCQHCGSELVPGTKFCPACGSPVNSSDGLSFQEPAKSSIRDGRLVPEPSQQEAGQAQQEADQIRQGSAPSRADFNRARRESGTAYGDGPDAPTQQASGPQSPAADKASGKNKRLRVAAIVAGCAAALVVVAVVAFVLTGGSGGLGAGSAVSFGQKDDVPAKLVTRFNPQDKGGRPLAGYSVLLVRQGEPEDGADESVYRASTTPYRLEVSGDQGFAMSDFGDDVPSGRYACYVVDAGASGRQEDAEGTQQGGGKREQQDGSGDAAEQGVSSSGGVKATQKERDEDAGAAAEESGDEDADAADAGRESDGKAEADDPKAESDSADAADNDVAVDDDTPCFIISFEPENKDAQDEVTVREPESGSAGGVAQEEPERDPRQVAYELYSGKVKEYLAKYGEPGSTTDEFATRLNGLYFVRLMDLDGDGLEELVIGYGDPSGAAGDGTTDCTLDVWTLKDDALVQVGSVKSASDHGQDALGWIPVATLDGAPVLFGGKPNVDIQGDVAWYGMVDGKLQPQLRLVVEPEPPREGQSTLYPPEVRYLVDGKEVDADAYMEAGKRVQVTENYAVVDRSGSIQTGNGAPLHTTQETLQMTKDTIAKLDEAAR